MESTCDLLCVWLSLSVLFVSFFHVVALVIPFCSWITFHWRDTPCLSVHKLVGIWTVSALGLLSVMLPWTFIHKSSREQLFSVLLGDTYLEGALLGHMVAVCFFEDCQTVFCSGCTMLRGQQGRRTVQFLHTLTSTCYWTFLFYFTIIIIIF